MVGTCKIFSQVFFTGPPLMTVLSSCLEFIGSITTQRYGTLRVCRSYSSQISFRSCMFVFTGFTTTIFLRAHKRSTLFLISQSNVVSFFTFCVCSVQITCFSMGVISLTLVSASRNKLGRKRCNQDLRRSIYEQSAFLCHFLRTISTKLHAIELPWLSPRESYSYSTRSLRASALYTSQWVGTKSSDITLETNSCLLL